MIRSSENFPSKAAQFLGNLAKKSERNGRGTEILGNPIPIPESGKMVGASQPSDFFHNVMYFFSCDLYDFTLHVS